jgi:protein-S-isoprenylcysteine O-methyltransferase Ste14
MLENRIPPVLIVLVFGAAMFPFGTDAPAHPIRLAVVFALLGVAGVLLLPAVRAFRKAKTTVNPIQIDQAASLVTGGIYGITRNPMYLGMVLILAAWATWLGGIVVWLGAVALLLWLDRFQIKPEERAMAARFGTEYIAYCARTRRWL